MSATATAVLGVEPPPVAPRGGAELVRATIPFEAENKLMSWLLLAETAFALAGALCVVFLAQSWEVRVMGGLLAGLLQMRLFIFYHDALHGAIFRQSRCAHGIMSLIGLYLIAVRSVWKETHDYHHQNNAKMVGSSVGSYPVLSVGMKERVSANQLRMYRLTRHPLTIVSGYFTIFLVGMVISPFRRNARRHWAGPLAAALHFAIFAAIWALSGWAIALCAVIVPSLFSMAIGAYLFYAQHNFPDMKLRGRRDWNHAFAALHSSSMFDMGVVMHWFTGNIGYHHVHHLNHRIPFYRLPEAMRTIPELQNPGRTSWRLKDIRTCCRLYLWDPQQDRMLTYREVASSS